MNLPVPRQTIEAICQRRDEALNLYAHAFEALQRASRAASEATFGNFSHYDRADERLYDVSVGLEEWQKRMGQALDRGVWRYLFRATDIEKLMDARAKEDFHRQITNDPPPATPDNCLATLSELMANADTLFKRGIANVFSRLDRRFRSHDGFKIGARIILERAFGDGGIWNYSARIDDTLRDIERTFHILDGGAQPDFAASFVARLREARRADRSLTEFRDPYFRITWFGNGNAHLWFLRPDLVTKVNQLLADYYGETLGDARTQNAPTTNRAVAGHYGFFETPMAVVDELIEYAQLWRIGEKLKILEPSAGLGRIALAAAAKGADVYAVEIDDDRAAALKKLSTLKSVERANFLDLRPDQLGLFDVVLMNPPFDEQRDIDHVLHAWQFVRPGGRLAAIMSASAEFSNSKRAQRLHAVVADAKGQFHDLPPGSFAESGTNVNTVVLTLEKPQLAQAA
jgi:predicted RNA methylase